MCRIESHPERADSLKVSGELDFDTTTRLHAILCEKLAEQHPLLVLDCKELNYIDSRGMAALIEYARDAKAFDGKLGLSGLKASLRTIFAMVQLTDYLLILEEGQESTSAVSVA